MARAQYILNNVPTPNLPKEWETLSLSVNWNRTEPLTVDIDLDNVTFYGEDAETIISFFNTYGFGVMMPFDIKIDGVTMPKLGLNARKNWRVRGCNEIEIGVDVLRSNNAFQAQSSGLQFRRLESQGLFIQGTDLVQVPYNLNYIPDGVVLVTLSISTFMMARELYYFIKEGGITAAYAGLIITSPLAIINALLVIAYFVGVVIAITNLINQIFEQIYSVTRYHTGVKWKSLFRVACSYLGLTFQSSIFDDPKWANAVYIPTKTERGRINSSIYQNGTPHSNDNGWYFFGQFLENAQTFFNAEYRISNGVLRFERWDWWQQTATLTLDDNWTNQDRLINEIGNNANEFVGGYTMSFQFDQKDQNTFDNFNGTVYDVITENVSGIGADYENDGGALMIEFPLARGTRKDSLTRFEEVLLVLATFVDGLVTIFSVGNASTNFANNIQNRIGNLHLSDHFIDVPKIVFCENDGRLSPIQPTASLMWTEFHRINSFVKINNQHNQWKKYTIPQRFCKDNFVTLLENNFVSSNSGNIVKVDSVKWIVEEDAAELEIAENVEYNKNLKQTYLSGENSNLAGNPFA
jgi:hypothetical protein